VSRARQLAKNVCSLRLDCRGSQVRAAWQNQDLADLPHLQVCPRADARIIISQHWIGEHGDDSTGRRPPRDLRSQYRKYRG
jgi:hypothetical protein